MLPVRAEAGVCSSPGSSAPACPRRTAAARHQRAEQRHAQRPDRVDVGDGRQRQPPLEARDAIAEAVGDERVPELVDGDRDHEGEHENSATRTWSAEISTPRRLPDWPVLFHLNVTVDRSPRGAACEELARSALTPARPRRVAEGQLMDFNRGRRAGIVPSVPPQPLPIDECLPAIAAAVATRGAAVVEAPPGAGKTTRVPRALLDGGAPAGEIWVLEPRRLPARLAATRVASELGERVGETVGYSVRFDEAVGPEHAPALHDRGAVRAPHAGRARACPASARSSSTSSTSVTSRRISRSRWLRRLRDGDRPDLAVVAMSATFDADPVADFLDGERSCAARAACSTSRSSTCQRPTTVRSAAQVAGAVRRVLRDDKDGDVLVFLPGAGEIRRAQAALADAAGDRRASRSCRSTARCRSRSRRAPCAPATGARSSCPRTSPSRR